MTATYVLVHGGAHGGWCWGRVAPTLRASGHVVHTPTLTGLGERAHLLTAGIDLQTHIADIVNVLEYEDLHDVILAGHSYGGMVITGVADRVPGRIRQLAFMDALQPCDGESMADLAPAVMAVPTRSTADGVVLTLLPDERKPSDFGVTDPADIAWIGNRLTPHPLACFIQPLRLSHEAALAAIPRAGIYCRQTLQHWPPSQVARARALQPFWEIDTGHDLMVTAPAMVAERLLCLASTRAL